MLLFITLIGLIFVYIRFDSLIEGQQKEINELKTLLKNLREEYQYLLKENASSNADNTIQNEASEIDKRNNFKQTLKTDILPISNKTTSEIPKSIEQTKETTFNEDSSQLPPPLPSQSIFKKIEAQFAGNFIGVAGTLMFVLGIVFLGVYGAIQFESLGKFITICSFSIIMFILSLMLGKKEEWFNISKWLRSASAIVYLFACIGSISIEGMIWVTDTNLALLLLSSGLILNIVMGFLNGSQVFASLHVFLTLAVLALLPVSSITFSIAVIITFFGIVMSSGTRTWDIHVVISYLAFTAVHLYWFSLTYNKAEPFPLDPIFCIILISLLGLAGIQSHYRKLYSQEKKPVWTSLAHLIVWIGTGANIYCHSVQSLFSTHALTGITILAIALVYVARKRSILWLQSTNKIIVLILSFITLASLQRWGVSLADIIALSVLPTLLILSITTEKHEKLIFNRKPAIIPPLTC